MDQGKFSGVHWSMLKAKCSRDTNPKVWSKEESLPVQGVCVSVISADAVDHLLI